MEKSLIKNYDEELKILNFYHTALRNIGQMTLIGFTILGVERYYEQKNKSYENFFLCIALAIFIIILYEAYILDQQLNILSDISQNKLYTNNLSNLPKVYGSLVLLVTIYISYVLISKLYINNNYKK